jgi:glycerol-3-phosphate acyltransferase PlsY
VFTPWLKFQGGKGVATALGVILAVDAQLMVLPMGVFILALWLTRHVSLGSILAAAMVPVPLLMANSSLFGPLKPVELFSWLVLVALVIWKHRENIKRLQEGTESKLWGAKKEHANG